MSIPAELMARAQEQLSAAQVALQRYVQISGGNQKSDLYNRFVHDVRIAAREYTELKNSLFAQEENS